MTRIDRMLNSVPPYYNSSTVYYEIQNTIDKELDRLEASVQDLRKQRRIATATWGLRLWEERLGIPTIESDGYEIRRSRVLSKWRGVGQFRASLVKSVAQSYANGEVEVEVDIPNYLIRVKFSGEYGIPPNIEDLKAALENIVHAHLGIEYTIAYLTWDELDAQRITWDEMNSLEMTWDELAIWKPNKGG